jgi:GLPGLI family protein
MKKNILLILMLCFSYNISAQKIKAGKIIYQYDVQEIVLNENDKNQNQNIVNQFTKSLKENRDKIKYELVFNENESNYKIVENLILESNKILNYAILLTGGGEEIYTSLNENIVIKEIEMFGEKFLVKNNSDKDWVLTQETKLIGGYKCYKAILKQTQIQNNIKMPDIEAWYCPEIPISFGPKGYSNLPGLILQLKIGPIVYLATKVAINLKEKINVHKPNKGKVLSEKEFDEMMIGIDKKKN